MHEILDAVVLCGGAGLRLRPVTGGNPKPLAPVAGRPFLELLFAQLDRFGFRRIILASGIGGDMIERHFGARFGGLDLVYSQEPRPLGTGGALKYAATSVRTTECLVMNGDSYTDVNLMRLVRSHAHSNAEISLVAVPADVRSDSGAIRLDGMGRVVEFREKETVPGARYLNAGIYVLPLERMLAIPEGLPISLERELFPAWISEGVGVHAFMHPGQCVDIGTPDRYEAAQCVLANAEGESRRSGKDRFE